MCNWSRTYVGSGPVPFPWTGCDLAVGSTTGCRQECLRTVTPLLRYSAGLGRVLGHYSVAAGDETNTGIFVDVSSRGKVNVCPSTLYCLGVTGA